MRVGNIIDGKWKVIEINERGGQGQVFKVKNEEENDVIYALKYLNKQNDSERRLRMHNEVRNISKLSNITNIIY